MPLVSVRAVLRLEPFTPSQHHIFAPALSGLSAAGHAEAPAVRTKFAFAVLRRPPPER